MSIFSLFCQLHLEFLRRSWQSITTGSASVGFSAHKAAGLSKKLTLIDPSLVDITQMWRGNNIGLYQLDCKNQHTAISIAIVFSLNIKKSDLATISRRFFLSPLFLPCWPCGFDFKKQLSAIISIIFLLLYDFYYFSMVTSNLAITNLLTLFALIFLHSCSLTE